MQLSIIIPSYNEAATIQALLDKVYAVDFEGAATEVIVVDDGSSDGTDNILKAYPKEIISLRHGTSRGKSAAIHTALAKASGEYVIIQDADLELDPSDIKTLYQHAVANNLSVLYGSRRLGEIFQEVRPNYLFYVGGVAVTMAANFLHGSNITDEPTCYKLLRRSLLNELNLCEQHFGFCPEVTAKVSRLGYQIRELPVKYQPRTVAEGKKIRWKDGVHALSILLKYRIVPKRHWHAPENKA